MTIWNFWRCIAIPWKGWIWGQNRNQWSFGNYYGSAISARHYSSRHYDATNGWFWNHSSVSIQHRYENHYFGTFKPQSARKNWTCTSEGADAFSFKSKLYSSAGFGKSTRVIGTEEKENNWFILHRKIYGHKKRRLEEGGNTRRHCWLFLKRWCGSIFLSSISVIRGIPSSSAFSFLLPAFFSTKHHIRLFAYDPTGSAPICSRISFSSSLVNPMNEPVITTFFPLSGVLVFGRIFSWETFSPAFFKVSTNAWCSLSSKKFLNWFCNTGTNIKHIFQFFQRGVLDMFKISKCFSECFCGTRTNEWNSQCGKQSPQWLMFCFLKGMDYIFCLFFLERGRVRSCVSVREKDRQHFG